MYKTEQSKYKITNSEILIQNQEPLKHMTMKAAFQVKHLQ